MVHIFVGIKEFLASTTFPYYIINFSFSITQSHKFLNMMYCQNQRVKSHLNYFSWVVFYFLNIYFGKNILYRILQILSELNFVFPYYFDHTKLPIGSIQNSSNCSFMGRSNYCNYHVNHHEFMIFSKDRLWEHNCIRLNHE